MGETAAHGTACKHINNNVVFSILLYTGSALDDTCRIYVSCEDM